MATRSAVATIKGYCYQFDKTILEILNAPMGAKVIVERIEDIDIDNGSDSKAIQCKYIPSTKVSPSVIRPALIPMLDDHASRVNSGKPKIHYHIYAYYSPDETDDSGYDLPSLDGLKSMLTFTENGAKVVYHQLKSLSDLVLEDLLSHLTIEKGMEFVEQRTLIHETLVKEFACGDVEADLVLYNNALRVMRDLSIEQDEKRRQITKKEFIDRINTKKAVFNSWYLELKGEDAYVKLVRDQVKLTNALAPQFDRFIFLESKYVRLTQGNLSLSMFIEQLTNVYFKRGESFVDVTPLTIIVDVPPLELAPIKGALLRCNIVFNDGYEHLEFQPWLFNAKPVVNTLPVGKRASRHLGKSSHQVRLLSADTYRAHAEDLMVPDKAIFFGSIDPEELFPQVQPPVIFAHPSNLDAVYRILT